MYNRTYNIRMIRRSLDMKVYKRILIAIAIAAGLGLLYGWVQFRKYDFLNFGLFLSMMVIFVGTPSTIWGFRMWKLFRVPEEYYFAQVKLTSFRQNWWPRGICFTVLIDHPEAGTVAVSTNPIFHATGWEQPLLEDYMNRTVTVGYNRETGMVVVIG